VLPTSEQWLLRYVRARRACAKITVPKLSSNLHASMNHLVRGIESEDSPLGDD